MENSVYISVIGGSQCTPEVARLAEEVGRELASRGAVLVCGGLYGVMEAACRGAKSAGGTTIGILPGDNRDERNAYVDIPIVTGLGWARNAAVVKTGQAVIAFSGRSGTISEIGCALQYGIPVVDLGGWKKRLPDMANDAIVVAESARDAVEKAIAAARTAAAARA